MGYPWEHYFGKGSDSSEIAAAVADVAGVLNLARQVQSFRLSVFFFFCCCFFFFVLFFKQNDTTVFVFLFLHENILDILWVIIRSVLEKCF